MGGYRDSITHPAHSSAPGVTAPVLEDVPCPRYTEAELSMRDQPGCGRAPWGSVGLSRAPWGSEAHFAAARLQTGTLPARGSHTD